jgi:hypothetical protein
VKERSMIQETGGVLRAVRRDDLLRLPAFNN